MADVTDEMTFRELDIVRIFDAPRQAVWDAWTDPDQLALWWGPAGMSSPRDRIEIDVRPGGVFAIVMVDAEGNEFPSDMRYTVVEPIERLGFAWEGQRGIGGGSATVTFKELGDGRTEMTDHYAGYTNEVVQGYMKQGSNQQYDKLTAHLAR
jgi:uncharacterized protein YndB with AHSA1/START domain